MGQFLLGSILAERWLPSGEPINVSTIVSCRQAADAVRILGIGRNEYIATMVQVGGRVRMLGHLSLLATWQQVRRRASTCLWCTDQTLQPSSWCSELHAICRCNPQAKSKKLMWRMNKGIVKDLLPQAPLPPQIGGCDPLLCGVLRVL